MIHVTDFKQMDNKPIPLCSNISPLPQNCFHLMGKHFASVFYRPDDVVVDIADACPVMCQVGFHTSIILVFTVRASLTDTKPAALSSRQLSYRGFPLNVPNKNTNTCSILEWFHYNSHENKCQRPNLTETENTR